MVGETGMTGLRRSAAKGKPLVRRGAAAMTPLVLALLVAGCATGGFESLGYSYDINDDRARQRLAVRPSLSSYAGRAFGNSEAEKEQEYKRLFRIAAEDFFQRSDRACEIVGEGREISRGGWAFDYDC